MTDPTTHHAEAILRAAGSSLRHYEARTREAILAAVREAVEQIMPRNLNLPDWLPDDATIPLDVPVSELRALAAALSQAGGASE